MISVCIPVFNTDVRELCRSLAGQAGDIPAEIILIDDGSDAQTRKLNRTLADSAPVQAPGGSPSIQYHQLEENIGRARIRNLFPHRAKYENLLFLDCDSVILSDRFLGNYAAALREYPGRIICGGRIYPADPPDRSRRLHWKYGTRRESRPAEARQKDPNRSFMTNNFLVPAGILREIPFDERVKGYGHEDSLFGYELAGKGQEIVHIENPVLHGELETNREFVKKTRGAVENLVIITQMLGDDPGFRDSITLLRTVARLEARSMAGVARIFSGLAAPLAGWLLRGGITSLKMLDLYKLGLYLAVKKGAVRRPLPGV